jgi:hypothetical protein
MHRHVYQPNSIYCFYAACMTKPFFLSFMVVFRKISAWKDTPSVTIKVYPLHQHGLPPSSSFSFFFTRYSTYAIQITK